MRFVVTAIALLTLTACGSAGMLGPGSPFGDITQLTVTDLRAALVRATKADDKPAMMCYPVLIGIVESLPGQVPDTTVAGIVDAFEAARLLTKKATTFSGGDNALIQSVNLGCAALYNDAKGDMLRLGVKLRP